MARPEKVRLGEILVKQNLLTEEQLQFCLIEHRRSGRRLGQVFIENGFVTEDDICHALARQLHIPFINLKTYNLNPNVVQQLGEMRARRFRAIVLEDRGNSHLVGMVDPTDLFVYDELARLLRSNIDLAVVGEEALLSRMRRSYVCCRRFSRMPIKYRRRISTSNRKNGICKSASVSTA
jgi:MSHA biogenesis protein MshE